MPADPLVEGVPSGDTFERCPDCKAVMIPPYNHRQGCPRGVQQEAPEHAWIDEGDGAVCARCGATSPADLHSPCAKGQQEAPEGPHDDPLTPAERAIHDRFRSLGCYRHTLDGRCLDPDDVEDCAGMAVEAIEALTEAGFSLAAGGQQVADDTEPAEMVVPVRIVPVSMYEDRRPRQRLHIADVLSVDITHREADAIRAAMRPAEPRCLETQRHAHHAVVAYYCDGAGAGGSGPEVEGET